MLTANLRKVAGRCLRPVPQWYPMAARRPQNLIDVQLLTAGARFDVTVNHVIAALKPLTIAIGLDAPLQRETEGDVPLSLSFVDRRSGRIVGILGLRRAALRGAADAMLGLFVVVHDSQRCVSWPYRDWNRWLQNRADRRNARPGNFSMEPGSLQRIMVFYICPRPVVLVSVDDGRHSNIFPMDLIGPVAGGLFTLALRTSN
ncbi:MAG: hypothetical protein JWN43_523, partial [Gammaproteobacteria bacterium]|nr:hypothetical protein [Gammaproteobacteria bacterium]